MKINPERIRHHLTGFNFTPLFVEELGWEAPRTTRYVPIEGAQIREVAHLGSIPALEVMTGEEIPDAKMRRAIHNELAKRAHENLLLFVDKERTRTLWYWMKREGKQNTPREHHFVKGQTGDLFLSKLAALFVDIEEYESDGTFSVLRAGQRLKAALDVSKVTRKFYGELQGVHENLVEKHLGGIPTAAEKHWYASVLLNRLMFVYFLQKKGFLDNGDFDYLEHRFQQFQDGNIYEDFLKPLFFKAFALPDDHPDKKAALHIFGRVIYLNGGLFLPHELEKYAITLANAGCDNILRLFQSVTWYLNDVPGADDNAMSPDVLGYVFEKYINDQKSAGAYYTPPEITEYLCERTIHDLLTERVTVLRDGKASKYESIGDLLLNLDADLCRVTLGELETLRLCDPAVGSGAFLVAALKTMTNIYGALWGRAEVLNDAALKHQLIGDSKKHQNPFYAIRKRIITQNLFGVDIMAEATEIARLRLFLSLVSSAKSVDELEPLPNIEFNILAGNSLMGLLQVGEKDFAAGGLFIKQKYDELCAAKERAVNDYKSLSGQGFEELQALKERAEGLRDEMGELCDGALLEQFNKNKIQFEQAQVTGKPQKRPLKLTDMQRLTPFHWGYEFPKVMESGGFDAIITNPPWEIWKPNSKEFFQNYSDVVTKKKMTIKEFETKQKEILKDVEVARAWADYLSQFPHVNQFFRNAVGYHNQTAIIDGRKTGTDINLYKLFTERCFDLLQNGGRCGIVIPSGIYTDLGAKQLREMLFNETQVSGLFGFENRKTIFEGVDSRFKFVALSFAKGGSTTKFPAAFMRHDVNELDAFPNRDSLDINVELVRRLSPDSLSVMEFKSEKDIEIAEKLLSYPSLDQDDKWHISFRRELHMTDDEPIFRNAPSVGRLPLYEGKMIHQFTQTLASPRYWVNEEEGRKSLLGRQIDENQKLDYQKYRLAYRAIGRNTDSRTFICTVLCPNVFTGNSINIAKDTDEEIALFCAAVLNSFVLDWLLRIKVSANINMFYIGLTQRLDLIGSSYEL